MKKTLLFAIVAATALFGKPLVSTSILPTKYFVEQIAGDTLDVNAMVEKGSDPHTYEPKPQQMKELEKSDLYFAVGIEFEDTWLEKFKKAYPDLNIIHTDKGIEKIKMAAHHHHDDDDDHDEHHEHDGDHHDHDDDHDHDGDHHDKDHDDDDDHDHAHDKDHHDHDDNHHAQAHHHHHGELDPHIWLDPMLVKEQTKTIAQALIEKFPENKKLYEENLDKFTKRLDELDKYIEKTLKPFEDSIFIVYHPSWGYFAKRYDLKQLPIEIEGKEPKPAELAELIEEAKEHNIKVIFVAPQFSQKTAKIIAKQTGSKVVEIDQLPLEWEKEMKKTAEVFAKSLKN
ncbi:metal ABC transporter solute-binding protein, Zn/Mn family [Campylobacter pinnipediorum]|uniref:metal ABC transporter solute-binding protein, Zn/Mn family n=1 Tax=Campylobacter pinnipediorum TaxID=1965231 RepID=UPI00084D56F6|nr:zinc ABC transporter substrate-binding protein [Campylobacter pinnipediorum]